MTREPAVRSSSGSRSRISVKGPTTRVARVASIPSGPIVRSGKIAPALSMRTSRRDSVASTWSAAARTDASEPMSATTIG